MAGKQEDAHVVLSLALCMKIMKRYGKLEKAWMIL